MRRYRSILSSSPGVEPVNVTPLIDVVMCLIIFFLIVGKLAANQKAQLTLPQTSIGQIAQRQDAVVVAVARDTTDPQRPVARITVDGQPAADGTDLLRILTDRLQRKARTAAIQQGLSAESARPVSEGKVSIRADKDLPYAAVEPVLSACAALGINKVDYATARADAGAGQ